jgi:hypothetical protein
MDGWRLNAHELKRYPHFDPFISADAAVKYATDETKVSRHTFYPFMRFVQRWTRFAPKGQSGKPKQRELRYAARRDAYIFSYYRWQLSALYEQALKKHAIDDCVLAYRRITDTASASGKCNIHFARDAFAKIAAHPTCCVIALDISRFFESLDHQLLKQHWCRLLGKKRLPPDHFAVFKAITQYSVVDKEQVFERLGHYGPKRTTKNGKIISGYLTPFDKIPTQLCRGKEFRNKIGGGGGKSIIQRHYKPYGIPQGAPISDLLANLYLFDFDVEANRRAKAVGGSYYRYSDDILFILPISPARAIAFESDTRAAIAKFGSKLEIKDEKSSIVSYSPDGSLQKCSLVMGDKSCKQGIEYLGFRFSGKRIYIRNRTLQGLYRKMVRAARREANALARQYPTKDAAYIGAKFNRESFIKRFSKVENFKDRPDDYKSWTFWTYAVRAEKIFGKIGAPVTRQLRRLREIANNKIDREIVRAIERRR